MFQTLLQLFKKMVGNLISLGGERTLYYANGNGWIE